MHIVQSKACEGGLYVDHPGYSFVAQVGSRLAQQNNFKNAYANRLACGIYTVLSSMYAVREWSIDFVEQSHINNARNWMQQYATKSMRQ